MPKIDVLVTLTAHEPVHGLPPWLTTSTAANGCVTCSCAAGAASASVELDLRQARFVLLDAVSMALKGVAQHGPLLFVLDDLHAADEPSLLLLEMMARTLRSARLLVICTHRDAPSALEPGVADLSAKTARNGQRIVLSGLDDGAVARWMGEAGGAPASKDATSALVARTDGNPLFIHELLQVATPAELERAAQGKTLAIPAGIRAVVRERVNRLGAEVRSILADASIAGRELDRASVQLATGRTLPQVEAAIEAAARAGLVDEGVGGRAWFSHVIVRDVLYEGTASERRAALHWKLGQALAKRASVDEALLSAAATHFVLGVPSGRDDSPAGRVLRRRYGRRRHDAKLRLGRTG